LAAKIPAVSVLVPGPIGTKVDDGCGVSYLPESRRKIWESGATKNLRVNHLHLAYSRA
jgi:hypothetical protein